LPQLSRDGPSNWALVSRDKCFILTKQSQQSKYLQKSETQDACLKALWK